MEVNDIKSLFSKTKIDEMWGDISDHTSELYFGKGGEYTIRIIGPTYKVSRCYVDQKNSIISLMTVQDFKDLLNGSKLNVPHTRHNRSSIDELEIVSNRSQWTKCLVGTAVLLQNNKNLDNNKIYYVAISSSDVHNLLKECRLRKDICLSGVKANNLTLTKGRGAMSATEIQISEKDSLLNKDALNRILMEGLKDAKTYYLELNQRNLKKKNGFFYSFANESKSSALDKHLEPINQIRNYIEEDQQHTYIQNDPKILSEVEPVSLFGFNEI